MKKIFIPLFALLTIVSCQKEESFIESPETKSVIISATIKQNEDSKVSYSEDSSTHALKQTWESSDVIFGFDESNTLISAQVASTSENGTKANFTIQSGALTNGKKVYMIYYPGKSTTDIKAGKLAVDLSEQSASAVPAIMIASGTVSDNTLSLSFENVTSVFGVKNPIVTGAASKQITQLVLSSHNIVAEGVISVNEGTLTMTPSAPSKFITKQLTSQTTDASGNLSGTYYIAVLPCSTDATYPLVLTARDIDGNIYSKSYGAKTIATAKYYYSAPSLTQVTLPTVAWTSATGVGWADRNLGAATVYDWGTYYRFAGLTANYTITSTVVNAASQVITQGENYRYDLGPYSISSNTYSKYGKASKLDPVDDIVQITYPGSGWRTPYKSDAEELVSFYNGTNDLKTHDKNNYKYYFELGTSPNSMIFPATGYMYTDNSGDTWTNYRNQVHYIIGEMRNSYSSSSQTLLCNGDQKQFEIGETYRGYGRVIRPVHK